MEGIVRTGQQHGGKEARSEARTRRRAVVRLRKRSARGRFLAAPTRQGQRLSALEDCSLDAPFILTMLNNEHLKQKFEMTSSERPITKATI